MCPPDAKRLDGFRRANDSRTVVGMNPNEMLLVLRRRPFEPFRLHLSDGKTYDITHPELCVVARTALYIGVPTPGGPEPVERVEIASLLYVTRMEPLAGATA